MTDHLLPRFQPPLPLPLRDVILDAAKRRAFAFEQHPNPRLIPVIGAAPGTMPGTNPEREATRR